MPLVESLVANVPPLAFHRVYASLRESYLYISLLINKQQKFKKWSFGVLRNPMLHSRLAVGCIGRRQDMLSYLASVAQKNNKNQVEKPKTFKYPKNPKNFPCISILVLYPSFFRRKLGLGRRFPRSRERGMWGDSQLNSLCTIFPMDEQNWKSNLHDWHVWFTFSSD